MNDKKLSQEIARSLLRHSYASRNCPHPAPGEPWLLMRPFEIISWHGPERSGGSAAGLLLEGFLGGPEELAHHELGGAALVRRYVRGARGRATRMPARGTDAAGWRCAQETCTGWWTGSAARRWPGWRSTGCWSGFCGSSATWVVIRPDSMQTPHGPEVSYSGHKGNGYEVQVAETCEEENATQLITHVEVTVSSGNALDVAVPLLDSLGDRGAGSCGATRAMVLDGTCGRLSGGGRRW